MKLGIFFGILFSFSQSILAGTTQARYRCHISDKGPSFELWSDIKKLDFRDAGPLKNKLRIEKMKENELKISFLSDGYGNSEPVAATLTFNRMPDGSFRHREFSANFRHNEIEIFDKSGQFFLRANSCMM